ncbi:hypothetical protein CXB51_000220 [Gossypium anomalum]|uniref:Uncharacterized protein n=1 Tax=Gossypium anomalum TaxID=47600 RepID=A0A8J5ZI59_9ROSI|nr:hypothetical protein CXB51_000220 [Gossypium anomalum]
MAKVSFVVFLLASLLSIQFVVGKNEDEATSPELGAIQFEVEQNEDEAASPELGAIQFVVGQNEDEAASPELVMSDFGEHFNKIITDPTFKSKLVEKFKSSVGDDSESVDGTISALADELAASPESMRVFPASVMSGFIIALQDGGVQGEQLNKIITDPNLQSGVAKLVEKFKSSVGDDSKSVDGTTSTLVDEVAASPESEVEIDTEIVGGLSRKMGKDGLVDLKKIAKAVQYDESNGNTENEKN